MEILITPQFHEKHEFKFAALNKSIAYRVIYVFVIFCSAASPPRLKDFKGE
jgi:hypothetical protein